MGFVSFDRGLRSFLEYFFSVVTVLGLLSYGGWQGLGVSTWTLDLPFVLIEISVIEALNSIIGFSVFMSFSAFLTFYQIIRQSESLDKTFDSSEKLVAIIPTYKDSHCLDISVNSLIDSDYDNIEIVPVCEEDDLEGIEKCKELAKKFTEVNYVVNDLYPGSKAGAINCAAEKTSSEYIAVFDADQEVQKGFITRAADLISEGNFEVIQSRIIPRPNGFIETLCYYEALFLNYIPGRLFVYLTSYRVAGSRGVLMSRDLFEDMGGYKPSFLTEDMDFTFRCYENKIRVKALVSEACTEEAPHSLRDYWGQRKRWVTGHFQVFLSRINYVFTRENKIRGLKSAIICGAIPLGWILLFVIISKFLLLALIGLDLFAALPILLLMIIGLSFRVYDRRYLENPRSKARYGLALICSPVIYPLYGLVSVKSVFESLFKKKFKWYRVEK